LLRKHMCKSLRDIARLRKPNLVVPEKSLINQEESRFFLYNKKVPKSIDLGTLW